jgi:23S rRNA pseudouridine2605 synthase
MEIDGYVISPAEVELNELYSGGAVLAITIHEGRNRQVRKMCELVGLKVRRLLRVSEGGLSLGELKSGSWRHLSPEEINLILSGREK